MKTGSKVLTLKFSVFIACLSLSAPAAMGSTFQGLNQAATAESLTFRGVFDFDNDSCLPSAAISQTGEINSGLALGGSVTGDCRYADQLGKANTYHRMVCVQQGADRYCVNMYALYFMKDQTMAGSGGHRHDWEFALVWSKNGRMTDASFSAHGKVTTKGIGHDVYLDQGAPKFVYHKDDSNGLTHAMRFAKRDEKAENSSKSWVTPTIVDWATMQGSAGVDNRKLRKQFNTQSFGDANCSFNDKNFPNEISKAPPNAYPGKELWKKAAQDQIKALTPAT